MIVRGKVLTYGVQSQALPPPRRGRAIRALCEMCHASTYTAVAHRTRCHGSGISRTPGTPNSVQSRDAWLQSFAASPKQVANDVSRLRNAGAEIVIVNMHLSQEMLKAPTATDRDFATRLTAAADIDLVVHHGPHVVQPANFGWIDGHGAVPRDLERSMDSTAVYGRGLHGLPHSARTWTVPRPHGVG